MGVVSQDGAESRIHWGEAINVHHGDEEVTYGGWKCKKKTKWQKKKRKQKHWGVTEHQRPEIAVLFWPAGTQQNKQPHQVTYWIGNVRGPNKIVIIEGGWGGTNGT